MKPRRTTLLLGAVALGLAAGAVALWIPESYWEAAWTLILDGWNLLRGHPVILYFLIVLLPAAPIPLSPFLVLGGIVYGESMGEIPGAALAASAVGLNITWCYFLTVGPLHRLVSRILGTFGYSVPTIPREDLLKFSFLVRVTPVFPLCVQNYILGLLKVPFHLYLFASFAVQVPLAFAIALTAGAIIEGNLMIILMAATVLLGLTIGLKWLRKALRKDPDLAEASREMDVDPVVAGKGGGA